MAGMEQATPARWHAAASRHRYLRILAFSLILLDATGCAHEATSLPNPGNDLPPPPHWPGNDPTPPDATSRTMDDRLPPVSTLPRPHLLWQANGLWVGEQPAVTGGILLARTISSSHVVALDVTTGKELWRALVPKAVRRSPLAEAGLVKAEPDREGRYLHVVQDLAVYENWGSGLAAFDLTTGKLRWTKRIASWIKELLGLGAVVAWLSDKGSTGWQVVAVDKVTGRARWTHRTAVDHFAHLAPASGNRLLLFTPGQSAQGPGMALQVLDASTGRLQESLTIPIRTAQFLVEPDGQPLILFYQQGLEHRTG